MVSDILRLFGLFFALRSRCFTVCHSWFVEEAYFQYLRCTVHCVVTFRQKIVFLTFRSSESKALQLVLLFATHFLAWARGELPCCKAVRGSPRQSEVEAVQVRTYWMPNIKAIDCAAIQRLGGTCWIPHCDLPGHDSRDLSDRRSTPGRGESGEAWILMDRTDEFTCRASGGVP